MSKKVLVINLGWEQEPLLDKLSEMGIDMYAIHYDDNFYKRPTYKDVIEADLRDLDKILKYADDVRPDAVISDQCDYSYFAQAAIAEKFKLPGPRIQEAQIAINKYIQRLKSKQAGINIPNFKLCTCNEDVRKFADENGFPIITKPIDNRGSFGVNKIENVDEIDFAFYDALANSHSRYILAEEFIDGVHITVDGYIFNKIGAKSLSLATKLLVGTKRQVAIDILYPGELNDDLYFKAMAYNEFVNNSLGFKFGMTHSEYMIKKDKIYLIETANRGGGVYTSEIIVPAVSNIPVVDQYVSDVLGGSEMFFDNEVGRNKVILKFFNFKSGRIKQITGIRQIEENNKVLKFRLNVNDHIEEVSTDANRHGFIIVSDNGNIRKTTDEILQNLVVTYE